MISEVGNTEDFRTSDNFIELSKKFGFKYHSSMTLKNQKTINAHSDSTYCIES
jgi:hypothetical protein